MKYVLFKLNDMPYFLLNIKDYFPDIAISGKVIQISEKSGGILKRVDDDSSVKLLIEELLSQYEDAPILTLISKCMNEYGEFYHKMTLKDWHKVVTEYIKTRSYDKEQTYYEGIMASEFVDL